MQPESRATMHVVVLVGLPGSGKSTFAERLTKCYWRISESLINGINEFHSIVQKCQYNNKPILIVIDRTNISQECRSIWIEAAQWYGGKVGVVDISCVYLDAVPAGECVTRIMARSVHPSLRGTELREEEVQKIVDSFCSSFELPASSEGFTHIRHLQQTADVDELVNELLAKASGSAAEWQDCPNCKPWRMERSRGCSWCGWHADVRAVEVEQLRLFNERHPIGWWSDSDPLPNEVTLIEYGLYVCGKASGTAAIARLGIQCVMSVHESRWEGACTVEVVHFGAQDNFEYFHRIQDAIPDFDKAVRQLHDWMNNGKTVIVHCAKGYNRSVVVILVYLITCKKKTWTLQSATDHLVRRRGSYVLNSVWWRLGLIRLDADECVLPRSGIFSLGCFSGCMPLETAKPEQRSSKTRAMV
jgi:predicted kinase